MLVKILNVSKKPELDLGFVATLFLESLALQNQGSAGGAVPAALGRRNLHGLYFAWLAGRNFSFRLALDVVGFA